MILKVIKGLPFLIKSGFIARRYKAKTQLENYRKLQQLSHQLLKKLSLTLYISGQENIPAQGPVLFISNHQGTLDPAIIVGSCDLPLSFISKKENEKLPILGQWAKNIGTIHFDRNTREGNIYMIRQALQYVKQQKSLVLFPEGTRSKSDNMNEFKPGSLQIAYLTKVDIIPITLNNAYILDKKTKSKTVSIHYGEVIRYQEYKDWSYEQLLKTIFDRIESKLNKD